VTTAYPAAADSYTRPTSGQVLGASTPAHSLQHDNAYDAIEALEAKLGTGASVAAANTVLRGTGAGASAFGLVQTGDLTANAVSQLWAATVSTTFPSTTQPIGSGAVLMPDMSVPIVTQGGTLLYLFECMSNNSAAGNVNVFDLFRGAGLLTRRQFTAGVAGYDTYCALLYAEALAAGSYTIEARWAVTAGTAVSIGNQRSLTIIELRR
jgi:hypothetical protein